MRANYRQVLLNSSGAEIQDLATPDVRTLVDATQGGANQHIRLTMQPTRPSHTAALRILDVLDNPAAAKWGGTSARRRAQTPPSEHGLVSIIPPNGMFYANTVGACGVVSAGQNWDRFAGAVRRRALKLIEKKKVPILLFPTTRFSYRRMRSPKKHFC